jgi:putative Mn2+ efflux pump MntP
MAFLGVSVWAPAVIIGLVAALMTTIGIRFGSRIGSRFQRLAEAFGGVVLVVIGVRILVSHLAA